MHMPASHPPRSRGPRTSRPGSRVPSPGDLRLSLDRRGLLRAGGALLSVAALAPVLVSCSREAEVPVTDAGSPLPIPPLLEPDADGRFALTAGRGTTEFLPDVASDTWGYNGQTYLGPTIRMQRGRPDRSRHHERHGRGDDRPLARHARPRTCRRRARTTRSSPARRAPSPSPPTSLRHALVPSASARGDGPAGAPRPRRDADPGRRGRS